GSPFSRPSSCLLAARFPTLLGGRRSVCLRSRGRGRAAFPAPLMRRGMSGGFAATGASRLLAAAVVLVHGGPGAPLGLVLGYAALLIPLSDMIGLALLLAGIFGFFAAWHAMFSFEY